MTPELRTLKTLVQFDSRTETPGESEITAYLAQRMSQDGLSATLEEAEPGRNNAIGVWKGSGTGPSLMFNGHVDTNPVGEGWTVDPWEGYADEKFLYGIGVSNMKAGCSAYLCAVEQLKEEGFQPRGDILLTFVIGELQNGVGTHAMLRSGWRSDFFVNCEPTDLQALTLHAGAFNFEIDLLGITRHISKREESVDAIAAACHLIPRLNSLTFTGASSAEHESVNRCNVGIVHGALGRGLSEARPPQVSDFARIAGTARFSPSQTLDSVLNDIRDELSRLESQFPGIQTAVRRLTKGVRPYFNAFSVDPASTIVRTMNRAWRDVRRTEQPTGTIFPCAFFGSDASHLSDVGMEGVVCGPGGAYNTMPDERVELNDYFDAIAIYKNVIVSICG